MGYSEQLADVYDLIFGSRGKAYAAEADEVARQVRGRFPMASSLLDVGCGTGNHLQRFREIFDHVEGVEPAPGMRRRAEAKLPSVRIHGADMCGLDLGREFDAVCCMFGPIGYMADESAAPDGDRAHGCAPWRGRRAGARPLVVPRYLH